MKPKLINMYPALHGDVVTDAHAKICREQGHATHTIDGVKQDHCPRCGVFRSEQLPPVKPLTTLEWLMKDDNAFNMGRFAFITERDDVIAGKVIWDRVLKMTTDQDEAWSNFVDGWNAAMNEFKGDVL